jgi:hypothetical protein
MNPSAIDEHLGAHVARGTRRDWHRAPGYPPSMRLAGALVAHTSAESAVWLSQIASRDLSHEDRLRRMQLADRVSAWAQAQSAEALFDYVGGHTGSLEAENDRRFEVRVARRSTDSAAGADIATARMLAGVCRPVRELWGQGAISFRHVHAVLDRVCRVSDHLAGRVMPDVVAKLPVLPTNEVGRTVTRLLARTDPEAMAGAARIARRHDVGVRMHALADGLAEIVATLRVEDARGVMDVLDSHADGFLAHRRSCEPCAAAVPDEIGPARAHALASLVLPIEEGAVVPSGTTSGTVALPDAGGRRRPSRSRRRGETQVVIDLPTLLGLAENPGLLGAEPVPAQIARELVATTGSLRRIVTDPVTGHLLDYGTRIYLPDALRDFVTARDGTCRSPGCRQPAVRSQLDHVVPFPAGRSDVDNTHVLCKRDHDTKGRGTFSVESHRSDGSAVWRTRDGQRGVTPARPYLNPPDESPPF